MSKYGNVTYGDTEYCRYMVRGYYILYKIVNGKVDYSSWKYEHRVAYEYYHNVELSKDSIVHHINHNKLDNSKENLITYTNSEHARMHFIERAAEQGRILHARTQPVCIDCGRPIKSYYSKRCVACSHRHARVDTHPTKEELSEMILTMNNSEIARKLNVSDKAVGKWRKKYGLPSASEQSRMKKMAKLHTNS